MRMCLFLSIIVSTYTITIFILLYLFFDEAVVFGQIQGSQQTCDRDGEIFNVDNVPYLKCYNCSCRGGRVECSKRKCQTIDGCYLLEESGKDECNCNKCKGCIRNNLYYESGMEWTESIDPCRLYSCNAGIITVSQIRCYAPCKNPLLPAPGHCCPRCLDCFVGNRKIIQETQIMPAEDPCILCTCSTNLLSCIKKTCPVLNCPNSNIIQEHNNCCPQCLGSNILMNPPNGACLLVTTGIVYQTGQKFKLDHCTDCTCENSTIFCERKSCPVLNCSRKYQKFLPDNCCAFCDVADEIQHQVYDVIDPIEIDNENYSFENIEKNCMYNDSVYKDGETWNTTTCESCICKDEKAQCAEIKCSIKKCLGNSILKIPDGECCPRCIESDGVCTVFEGSHVRTFDDKVYAFVGTCKYQLVSDCDKKTFNIRWKNEMSGNYVITKRIAFKLGNVKIDLQENRRTKVNDQIIDLPYELENNIEISGTKDEILVNSVAGIKIYWNYGGFFEVTVPSSYKKKLCGLCGDFNSIKDDDLTTREGILVEEPSIFAQSWVAGDEVCLETKKYGNRGCQPKRDQRLCNYIKGSVFERCLRKINVTSYYETCLKDMCECPPGDLQCYCESFTTYVRDCNTFGIMLSNWQKAVGC